MNDANLVSVKLLRPGARLPQRATEGASGFDLAACLEAGPITVRQAPVAIPTGLALAVPLGYDAQIRPRSGLGRRGVISTFGTLDADYRGELFVTMYTISPEIEHVVHHGDRIAQLVFARLADLVLVETDALSTTERGEGGHGSTGR